MLQVTPSAIDHLRRVRTERGVEREVPRLVGNGALVGFRFATQPAPDDRRIECEGGPIYVASNIADALDQTVLDARPGQGRDSGDGDTTLVLRLRPGATFAPAGVH